MKEKCYGTLICLSGEELAKMKVLGYSGNEYFFRIVCRAESRAEANRIAESKGLHKNTFRRENSSITGNLVEIEMATKYGFVISLNGSRSDNFISIDHIYLQGKDSESDAYIVKCLEIAFKKGARIVIDNEFDSYETDMIADTVGDLIAWANKFKV